VKILVVDYDDILLSFLAKKLEASGYEIVPTHFGDGELFFYKKHGPWEFVLSDYKFIPGVEIKNGVELVNAIHAINPAQRMGIMTAWRDEVR
jgi:response regulator RpfG family c-di-GMP phosphodiesterase